MLQPAFLVLLFSVSYLTWNVETPRQTLTGASITYSLPSHRLSLHEPVILTFSIKNSGNDLINIDLGQNREGGFAFTVTRPDGRHVELPQYRRDGISRIGTLSLKPGEAFSQRLILNEWYAFPVAGKYELEGHLIQPIVTGSTLEERDPGFRGAIEVGPRDEPTLSKVCESLADQVDKSQGYEQAAEAALTLSYVTDPVAVPSLQRVLFARKIVDGIAIAGLERIGDDQAVRVLVSALDDNLPGDKAILARAALQRIEQVTSDATRKETISRALARSN